MVISAKALILMGGVCGSGQQTAERQGFNRHDTQDTVDTIDLGADDDRESSSNSVGYDPSDNIAREKEKITNDSESTNSQNELNGNDTSNQPPISPIIDNEDGKEEDFLQIDSTNITNNNNNNNSTKSDSVGARDSNQNSNADENDSNNDNDGNSDGNDSESTIDRAALIADQIKDDTSTQADNNNNKDNDNNNNNGKSDTRTNVTTSSIKATVTTATATVPAPIAESKTEIERYAIIGTIPDTIDTPGETQDVKNMGRKGFESDTIVLEALKKEFGTQFNSLKVEKNTFNRYVIGYRHIKNQDERIAETIKHLHTYFGVHIKLDFDSLLSNKDTRYSTQIEMEGWPVYVYGQDKQGHIIMWDEIGSVNVKKLDSAFLGKDFSLLQLHRARVMRRVENLKMQMQKKYNCPHLYKHTMIFDMKHFSLTKHGAKERRNMCKQVIEEMTNMYPESVFRIYVLNAPAAFRAFFQILKVFMDQITADKTRVLGKNYLKELLKDIDIDMIPPKHGGNGVWKIQYCEPPKGFPLNSLYGL